MKSITSNPIITNGLNLEYNQESYKKSYNKEFVTEFSHGSMAKGPVDKEEIKKFIEIMNLKASKETKTVDFNASLIEETLIKGELVGGSCSSIAFKIAHLLMDKLNSSTCDNENIVQCMNEIVRGVNKSNKNKRKEIRNIQSAFNTIFVDDKNSGEDISQHKIKALAAFYDLKVSHSTEDLLIEETNSCKIKFEETISKLDRGVYLVRVIQRSDNHKLETQGHSTIFIKSKMGDLYFDTQLGLYHLKTDEGSKDQKDHIIYQSLCSAKKRFNIEVCKFHKLGK